MDESRFDEFRKVYTEELGKAVAEYPDEYPWSQGGMMVHGNVPSVQFPARTVAEVAEKMMAAVRDKSFNKDGRAFKATFKRLGIKPTYTALREWLGQK